MSTKHSPGPILVRLLIAGPLLVALFGLTSSAHAGSVLYAAPTASGSGDCSSWDNACTLQTALNYANSGDQIWVKAGVHYPGASGERSAAFVLTDGVALYGGFAGTETNRDQRNWQANRTILSGDIDRNDINTDGNFIAETWGDIRGANSYQIVKANGVTDAVLDGFVVTAGQANGSEYPNNSAGGMENNSSNVVLRNVIFSGNWADSDGGGMANFTASPTLINVTFSGNAANGNGGGMANGKGSNPTLINVTFSGNSASTGGGMYNYSNSNPSLTNAILWGNTGASIHNDGTSTPLISYSDIQGCGGSGSGWHSACGTDGGHNIDADPRFVFPPVNLRLQLTSPAIDAGNNAAVPAGVTTDLDGRPRFLDVPVVPDTGSGDPPIVDMGPYETRWYGVYLPLVLKNAP